MCYVCVCQQCELSALGAVCTLQRCWWVQARTWDCAVAACQARACRVTRAGTASPTCLCMLLSAPATTSLTVGNKDKRHDRATCH